MIFEKTISAQPFNIWLLREKENRKIFLVAIGLILIQFLLFKIFYPYPNFMPPDSSSYMEAAYRNTVINMWPIGYSKFLRLFSSFTISHVALVWFQYLLLEVCIVYFLITIRYLLSPGKWAFRILFLCSILDPLVPHISNFVSSDALFTSLSLIWFTQLFWLMHLPNRKLLIWHSIVLLLAFMVRYNALYYPFISIATILFNDHLKAKTKAISIGLVALLLFTFIGRTQYAYNKMTGTAQFSAFGGWQIAANALYGYAHVPTALRITAPSKFQKLHSTVNQHMNALRSYPYFLRPDREIGVYYLWDFNSPLKVYMDDRWPKDTTTSYFKKWAAMAPLYSDYGWYLIKQYPTAYLKHYLWPNFIKFYIPPPGFLDSYNLRKDTVDEMTVAWFRWKDNKVHTFSKNKQIVIVAPFQIGMPIINVLFVLSFLSFVLLGGFKNCQLLSRNILRLVFIFWLCNLLFSVFSAPIELRYQLFPMIVSFCFLWHLIAFILKQSRSISIKTIRDKGLDQQVLESPI